MNASHLRISITFIDKRGLFPFEIVHQIRHEDCDSFETQSSDTMQHMELVLAAGLFLFKVEGESAPSDDVQAVVVEIFCNSAYRGWMKKKLVEAYLTILKLTNAVFTRWTNDQMSASFRVSVDCRNSRNGCIALIVILKPRYVDEVWQNSILANSPLSHLNHRGNLGIIFCQYFTISLIWFFNKKLILLLVQFSIDNDNSVVIRKAINKSRNNNLKVQNIQRTSGATVRQKADENRGMKKIKLGNRFKYLWKKIQSN